MKSSTIITKVVIISTPPPVCYIFIPFFRYMYMVSKNECFCLKLLLIYGHKLGGEKRIKQQISGTRNCSKGWTPRLKKLHTCRMGGMSGFLERQRGVKLIDILGDRGGRGKYTRRKNDNTIEISIGRSKQLYWYTFF